MYKLSILFGKIPRFEAMNNSVLDFALCVPWFPEDIFFLSILMVGGEAALTRKKKPLVTGVRNLNSM